MATNISSPDETADVQQTANALIEVVDALARELHAGNVSLPDATLDSSLEHDFALDSLARVELSARIDRTFDVTLTESLIFDAQTPRDLLRGLMRARGVKPLAFQSIKADTRSTHVNAAPDGAETLVDVLAWHVANHGERPHIQFYDDYTDGAILTYRDLWQGASAVAAGLRSRNLDPGERVALMLPTSSEYFFAFFGVLLAGGVPVPIYPPVRRQQIEDHLRRQSRILANCRAAMLLTTADASRIAHLLRAAVASLRHVLTVSQVTDRTALQDRVPRAADDIAFLQYTSGSTGDPKGVILSHHNLLANIRADGIALEAQPNDVFVSWLPLYHDMGLIGAWLGSLYHAVRLVIMPPLTFLAKPQRWLWAIHRYGGTLSAAPNFAFELCCTRITDEDTKGVDLSHWRIVANGAEAISARTLDAFCARFEAYGFRRQAMFPVYGLAECAVGLTFPPPGRGPLIDVIERDALTRSGRAVPVTATESGEDGLKIVACGQPLPQHEIRVVDEAGRELPERHEGRLQFRGPSATSGYYERPAETDQLFENGWLQTGDRAYIAAGDLYLTGRTKDIIIRAGRNIYPAEVEDAIGDLDGIRKGYVAVFGTMDADTATERIVVVAETRRRRDEAQRSLRRAINARASDLMATPPDEVILAPPNTVLRTSSGKIRRSATRTLHEAHGLGKSERALWLQVLRLAAAGIVPQLRRAARAVSVWCYAAYAWSVFVMLATAAWACAWLPLPRLAIWRIEKTIARCLGIVTATRIKLTGLNELPAAGEPCVIVANHQSYLDGLLLFAVLPRPPRFVIKGELRDSWALARPLKHLGGVFVERFDAAESLVGFNVFTETLAGGDGLTVFPEGTFKRMPGLLPFHMGAFAAAAEAAVPVVPIAIRGTRSILRAGTWIPRHGEIIVNVGTPVVAPAQGDHWQTSLALRDGARAHILAHSGEPDLAHESNVVDSAA